MFIEGLPLIALPLALDHVALLLYSGWRPVAAPLALWNAQFSSSIAQVGLNISVNQS